MDKRMLLSNLDVLTTAPGGVARLRELILTLAVQGKLVPQDPADEPASVLLQKIRTEKDRLMAEGKIKRDKPLAEIAEEDKPFELPAGWEWVRCDDYFLELCTGPFGSMIHQEDYVRDGVPLINPSHMVGGRIIHDPRVTINVADAERLSAYALSAGDMVLARRGEVGRYAYVTEQERGWLCGTGSFFVRLYSQCNREYLGLIFSDVRFRRHLQGESVGTTMTNLNQRILLNALLALPPLAEQSRIVTRVEALMRLCDALQAKGQLEAAQHAQLVSTLLGTLADSTTPEELADNWQRVAQHFDLLLDRPEAIDALEQTLLQLAVRGLLTLHQRDELFTAQSRDCSRTQKEGPFAVPVDWEWCRLGEVAELINGDRGQNYPNKSEYVPAGVPFINTGHIDPDGSLSASRMHFLTRKKFDSLRSGKVRKGDLVYCLRGATLGKTAIVDYEEGAIASSLVIVRPSPKLDNKFLLLYLTSPAGRSFIWQHDNGSAQPNLAAGSLKKYWIPLPPLAEQSRVVTRVTALRRLCADLRQRLKAAQVTQSHLAQALVDSTSFV